MSDEKKKEEPKPKGKAKGLLLGLVGLVLVIGVSSIAGAALSPIIGPRMHPQPAAARPHKPPPAEGEEGEDAEEEGDEKKKDESKAVMMVDAIVVDLRATAEGEPHHLKIGLALELRAEYPEEEAKLALMRVKDAAITYLRTLTYEDVTEHDKFEAVRKELSARVIKAAGGKKHAKKMLISEYVVQ